MSKTKSKKRSSSSSLKNKKTFSKGQLGFFALLFAVVGCFMLAVSLAAPAGKGKPGSSGGGGSLSLVMVTDANSDGLPNYKDQVTFNVVTTVYSKWVELLCYQNGTLVYSQQAGYFPEYPWGTTYSLGPTYLWNGGAADCTATLFTTGNHGRRVVMATIPVHVNP
ncbi:hypothetical protein KW803_00035 [Candidatus Saccharibacteria bacterium]|nr:hypothetical protein [Candidatus Saccharibacteria bacterium]